jgi:ubiquinone/menaquinone biosynthesis C-methylase UbiE
MKKSTEKWKEYWAAKGIKEYTERKLNSYQMPVYCVLKNLICREGVNKILNAGAGIDLISLRLQKEFDNKLDITILDISPQILKVNEKLFKDSNLNSKFMEADVFDTGLDDDTFDLVYNTGLLEHFDQKDQKHIIKEILRILKPSGYIITANTNSRGRIYRYGMETAKKKDEWEYGREDPLESLNFLAELDGVEYLEEFSADFFTQLFFLKHINLFFGILFKVAYRLFGYKYIFKFLDLIFLRFFGGYLLISVIKKTSQG